MSNEKFKNEVLENAISNSAGNSQENLFDLRDSNEVSKDTNATGNADTTNSPGDQTRETPSVNETTGKTSETTEGAQQEEKRGRKPLTPEQQEAKNKKDKERRDNKKNGQTSLVDDLSKYKTVPSAPAATTAAKEEEIDLAKYISGALLLIVIDAFIPSLIVMVAGFVDPKYKNVDKKKLKLTGEEKKELEPLADGVIKHLFGKVHPAIGFLVAAGMLYAGKLMSLDDDDFEPKEKTVTRKKAATK